MDKDAINSGRGHAGSKNRVEGKSIDQEEALHVPLEFVEIDLHVVNNSSYNRSARMRNFFYYEFSKSRN